MGAHSAHWWILTRAKRATIFNNYFYQLLVGWNRRAYNQETIVAVHTRSAVQYTVQCLLLYTVQLEHRRENISRERGFLESVSNEGLERVLGEEM